MSDDTLNEFGTAIPERDSSTGIEGLYIGRADDDDDDDNEAPSNQKRVQWSSHGSNTWIGVGNTIKQLNSGMYEIGDYRGEATFERKDINVDDFLRFPDSKSDKVLKEIEDFWSRAKLFKEFGFLHRRGYLFWGIPGGGKTVLVQQIIKQIIDKNGIVFMCSRPDHMANGLHTFREIEPNRPVVCVFEDIDAIIEHYGEDKLLSILDGENQIDKVLTIATTNYPEKLDKRIVSRPRRFDRVVKIEAPSNEVRSIYFKKKMNIKEKELKMWVEATNGFTFASMAELVISVKCLGNDFNKTLETLKKLMNNKPSSVGSEGNVGFGANT